MSVGPLIASIMYLSWNFITFEVQVAGISLPRTLYCLAVAHPVRS